MDDPNSVIYGVDNQTRSLCSSNSDTVQFFIGTQSLKPNNQIHCIELLSDNDDSSVSYKTTVYSFPLGEIWQLKFSPHESDVMACTFSEYQNSQVTMKTALLKIPSQEMIEANQQTGQEYLQFNDIEILETNGSEIKTTEFNPSDSNLLAIVLDDKIRVLSKTEASYTTVAEVQTGKNAPKFNGGKWSQQNANQFICLHENSVRSYDTRDINHVAWTIEEAHSQQLVRDLDCNPNKQCHLVTGGDDGTLKIWDCRSVKQPVFSRADHNHWIFSVRFNTFHDSLVLSSSSDNKVILTCARSVSSEADEEGIEKKENNLPDGLLQMLEQHEDSIYCCEWSSADPFTFASLSFDGRIIISQVPKQYKYQFLM
uniref:CSON011840 protein n=1 Tax=Culicoides sonorensis TaxID=179676 RepID=A0A336M4U1_CULSO